MSDPLGLIGAGGGVRPVQPTEGLERAEQRRYEAAGGASFKQTLIENLKQVDQLQEDATRAMEDFQTGRRDDLEGVILAAQKAETAFQMLLAVRNRVLQAYDEVKEMRV